MHVLVVDDDPGTCETLAIGLRALADIRVATADTGNRGLMLAAARPYDVVVIDSRLPDTSGLQVLAGLRRTVSAGATAYIYTAYGSVEEAVAAIRCGAANYLRKEMCDVVELTQLISATRPNVRSRDSRIHTVLQLIASQPRIQSSELAAAVNLSESRLRHLFAAEMCMPLGEYHRTARLQRAALLLRVSLLPIKELASLLGWSDIGAFDHAFREVFGLTPSRYRTASESH